MTKQELSTQNKQDATHQQEQTRPGRTYVPEVDIYETADNLWVWADMPGVDEHDIDVNVENGVLSIEGRVSLKDYEAMKPVYTEYNVGNYVRRFTLSNEIDTDKIKARVTNGVLELELPKSERAKPRRISISAH